MADPDVGTSQTESDLECASVLDPVSEKLLSNMDRRIQISMLVLVILGVVAGTVFGGVRMGLGIALGGTLSFFNERWLSSSTRAIIEFASSTGNPTVPRAMRFFLRLVVVAVVIWIANLSGYFDLLGIGIGFTSFVGAAMIEGVWQALHN